MFGLKVFCYGYGSQVRFFGGGEKVGGGGVGGRGEFHQILWERTQNGPEMMF